MIKTPARNVLVAGLLLALAGCSSAGKRTNGTSAASKATNSSATVTAGKVRQDLTQTQVDLDQLESEARRSR